jgi:hypothetical protein
VAAIARGDMKRIAFLSILFAALIEFVFERPRFDLWIMVVAIVAILWKVAGPTLRSRVDSQKHDHTAAPSGSSNSRATGSSQ